MIKSDDLKAKWESREPKWISEWLPLLVSIVLELLKEYEKKGKDKDTANPSQ